MFRVWCKIVKNQKAINDKVVSNNQNKQHILLKLDAALDDVCLEFDLAKPLWFDSNYKEVHLFKKATFNKDHFMEPIHFDYLELEIIEDSD